MAVYVGGVRVRPRSPPALVLGPLCSFSLDGLTKARA